MINWEHNQVSDNSFRLIFNLQHTCFSELVLPLFPKGNNIFTDQHKLQYAFRLAESDIIWRFCILKLPGDDTNYPLDEYTLMSDGFENARVMISRVILSQDILRALGNPDEEYLFADDLWNIAISNCFRLTTRAYLKFNDAKQIIEPTTADDENRITNMIQYAYKTRPMEPVETTFKHDSNTGGTLERAWQPSGDNHWHYTPSGDDYSYDMADCIPRNYITKILLNSQEKRFAKVSGELRNLLLLEEEIKAFLNVAEQMQNAKSERKFEELRNKLNRMLASLASKIPNGMELETALANVQGRIEDFDYIQSFTELLCFLSGAFNNALRIKQESTLNRSLSDGFVGNVRGDVPPGTFFIVE